MEIHSSSLSFFTANENSRNKRNTSLSSTLKQDNEGALAFTSSQQEIISESKTSNIQSLTADIEKQQNTSFTSGNNRALNLYIRENTQSLQNQRTDLISKIDFFI